MDSIQLDYQLNKTVERWNPADLQRDDMMHFDTSYFSIVNETLFYKDTYRYKNIIDIQPTNSVFLSEKIYKPLCMKHPFVVVGVDGTLQALRQFGYQTFDKWIDEQPFGFSGVNDEAFILIFFFTIGCGYTNFI